MNLKYLLAGALLLGQFSLFSLMSSTSVTVETDVCGLPGTPVIVAPSGDETTSTQDLTVSGTADDNTTINILDNSTTLASVTSDSSGDYGAIISLSSGSNEIVAQAENNCSQTANSSAVDVTYNPPAPPPPPPSSGSSTSTTVSVPAVAPVTSSGSSTSQSTVAVPATTTSPLSLSLNVSTAPPSSSSSSIGSVPLGENFTTVFDSVFITGSTGRPATVEILEGRKVIARVQTDSSGNFGARIPLKFGTNILTFIITSGGQTITKTVRIVRTNSKPPVASNSLRRILLYALVAVVIIELAGFFFLLIFYRRRRRDDGNNQAKI